jgi:uncharacterized protein (TIGR03437 family)
MKLANIPAFLFLLVAAAPQASGIITLGLSNQNFGLAGIGGNASGAGQSKMTWGSCAFDGTNTTCSLTGPYTGLGAGGTYSFTVKYTGNGPFPLNAVSQTPGSDLFFAQATNNFDFFITLTQNSGPVISFYSFANFSFFFSGATCTGVTAASCSVGQVGLTPNATITGPVTGSFDPAPAITPSGVVSAANYGGFSSIAPSTWIEIYGVNLATTRSQTWGDSDFNGNQAPSALGGTTVTVAGKPAFVDFVSPGQVNVQVPSGVPTGVQPIVVTTAGGSSSPYGIRVNTEEPGLLAPPAFIINGKQNVVALFSNTLTFVLPNTVSGATTARARAGDNITLYGIGFGLVTPDTPAGQVVQQTNALQSSLQITFAGVPATVNYAGLAPGYVGLYQFNIVVPKVNASDTVPVAFTLGSVTGPQNLVIAIQN